ncbi:ubiquinol-cytochrome c reductase cytochrome b subunit [Tessaracoccus rhinocerotis]|uniref:Cytochrome bc1 complex cytochrome b subunit n=1 Tax=Tessaracoccus rhinocerotis TaxID=1689449 RepID=A0A553K299_9ACTN|nr:cytochrome b N-terminal domain-containing protein [Tessaracoccus rhinocerotis]TRY18840.1 ubiquinol-cytochrome c reductase cytochrome b subunit [Tessaracoccus rhinocerotis]
MARPTTIGDASPVIEPAVAPTTKRNPAAPALKWGDDRVGLGKISRFALRKVFPDHWSFLLGEIALYSFIILLLTGVFLTIWFKPSMAEIEYDGTYQLLKGIPVSEAFASTLHISFDVRGGLLVRQIHHWAALLFVAAAFVHMLRVFFTGAYRKPREVNWLVGIGLMALSTIAGFAGYSLPDDLLSGTGLRFADGLIRSIPIIGTWAEFFVFGGEFPGELIIARLYMVHILLVPGLLLGLVSLHLALVVYHKHTQFPGAGRTENNVVGYPVFPVYAAKAGGFFFVVFGFSVLLGGLVQINPVWLYGPYDPAKVTAGSQPDWYMGWLEGAVRIMPGWETHVLGTTWSWNVFLPGVGLMGLLFTLLGLWPFVERWLTGDTREHHLLQRPRNAPTRTAFGVAGMVCFALFLIAGGNDIVATRFGLSLNAITVALRVLVFLGPVIAFIVTKRICLGLQRKDRERVLHGSETGIIQRSPGGGYSEPHLPIHENEKFLLTQHVQRQPLEVSPDTDENGVRISQEVSSTRARLSRWYLGHDVPKPTAAEIAEADHHGEDGHELEGQAEHQALEDRQPEPAND